MQAVHFTQLSANYVRVQRLHDQWRRRLRFARASRWTLRGALAGLSGALIASLVVMQRSLLLQEAYLGALALLTVVAGAAAALLGFLWPRSPRESARIFDRMLDLKERLSTAVELSDAGWPGEASMALWQLEDTVQACERVDVRANLRPRVPRRELVLLSIIGLLAVLPLWLEERSFEIAAQQEQVDRAIEAELVKIEKLREELSSAESLDPAFQEQIQDALRSLETQLEAAQSAEEALSSLAEATSRLSAITSTEGRAVDNRLHRAGQAIRQTEGEALAAFGEGLEQGRYEDSAEALESLDLRPSSPDALAQELEAAAEALRRIDPQLAESLQSANNSLLQGDRDAAQQSLERAAETIRESAREVRAAELAGQVADQLSAAQGRLLEAVQQEGGSTVANQGDGPGSLDGESSRTDPTKGDTEGGSGAGRGEAQEGSATGSNAAIGTIGQGNNPGDGGERPYQPLQESALLGGTGGPLVTLPGTGDPGELLLGAGPSDPGQTDPVRVPYLEVLTQYETYARTAIDNLKPPPHLEGLVHDYFSALAP